MWLLITLCLWPLVLIFHSVYRFLPDKLQKINWIKYSAIVSVSIVLIFDIYKNTQEYQGRIYADISKDGTILKGKNFPWKITKTDTDGNIIYIINERHGDASNVSINPKRPVDEYTIYNAIDGVGIKFSCPEEKIPNFRIKIKN
jgi:hypothetical protein